MVSFAVISAFLRRIGPANVLIRGAILSVVVGTFLLLWRLWPSVAIAVQHALFVLEAGIIRSTVLLMLAIVIGSYFLGLVVGRENSRKVTRGAISVAKSALWYGSKCTVMTIVNTAVLCVNILYAAVSSGQAQDRVFDACIHYSERMTDLIFRPAK